MGEGIGDLIRLWRKRERITQAKAAKLFGIGQPMISDIERGIKGPAREKLLKISKVTGIAVDELLGKASEQDRPIPPFASMVVRAKSFRGADLPERREDLLEVPVMGDAAAAGLGRIVSDDDVSGVAWIPRDQLAGRDRHSLRAIRVSGQSMEPMIHNGALVVIDCDDREKIDPNAVYAVRDDGEGVTLKHIVFREKERKLILVASNRNLLLYPPREVDLKHDASPVIGRAIWVGQGIA